MNFKEFLNNNRVYFDGGMGTLLQEKGLAPGEKPELWNITRRDDIISVHKAYFDAGSNVVTTNTFGANLLHFDENELEQIVKAAIENAKEARGLSRNTNEKFVALDIGPTGRLLKPLGDLDFEEAVTVFGKTAALAEKYGADLIIIETMNDCYETKAALLGAKENSSLPVIVTNAYGEDSKLMTGASPAAMVALLEGMGADALGANCSLGPRQLKNVAEELLKFGAKVQVKENEIIVKRCELHAPTAPLSSHNDHRIAMALSVICSVYGGEIYGAQAVSKSFPDYFSHLNSIGIKTEVVNLNEA